MRILSIRRVWSLATLLGVALVTSCTSVSFRPPSGDQSLEVALIGTEHPTEYVVQLTNSGEIPVAVCPCIGPPTRFIVFDLYYEEKNRSAGYPEVLFSDRRLRRFYRCLQPGQSLSVQLDLRRWEPVWDGQHASFPRINLLLGPGSYRVRARYMDFGEVNRWRCPGFRGQATSEWVTFEAPE